MSTRKLSNISLKEFRKFLKKAGCKKERVSGGHEHWTKPGINRPITLQTHKDPVPRFIVRNLLRTLGLSKKDYFEIMDK